MAFAGGGAKSGQSGLNDISRGMLINDETNENVDLFIVDTEEVELANDISRDERQQSNKATTSVLPQPTTIRIEGFLSQATHKDPFKMVDKKPVDKISKLVKFANYQGDNVATCTLVAPSLPFTYFSMFPKSFSYRANKSTNTVDYTLVLTELGLQEKVQERHQTNGQASSSSPDIDGFSSEGGGASSEDWGLIKESGTIGLTPIEDKFGYKSIEQFIQERRNHIISSTSTSSPQHGTTQGLSGLIGSKLSEPVGKVVNQSLSRLSFGEPVGLNKFGQKYDFDDLRNIPYLGDIFTKTQGLPGDTEVVLPAYKQDQKKYIFTMKSPVMQRIRNGILKNGLLNLDIGAGKVESIISNKIYNSEESRIAAEAWKNSAEDLELSGKSQKALQEWVNTLPPAEEKDEFTFYSPMGQPLITFAGIIDIPSTDWQRHSVDLHNGTLEFSYSWSNAGFLVLTIRQPDGTPITKEHKVTLGSDIMSMVQGMKKFNGIHIVPMSFSNDKKITKDNIGSSVFLTVIYTNSASIRRLF